MTYSEKCRAVESLLGAKTCVSYMKGDTLDRILALAAKAEAGQRALCEAGVILNALHYSIEWELAPEVKGEIARTRILVNEALGINDDTTRERAE